MYKNLIRITNPETFKKQDPDKFYTYLHITMDEDIVFYVGKGKLDRCLHYSDRNQFWNNVVNKHDYYIFIESINLTEKEAFNRETELIAKYKRKKDGGTLVNLTDGGEGVSGRIYTEEEKKAISDRIKADLERFQSIGNRSKYFGKRLFGKDNPNYGNRGSLNPMSKAVVQLDLQGNFVAEYGSIIEASEATGISSSGIGGVCLKKRHQVKNFIFRYKSEYDPNNLDIKLGPTNRKPVLQLDKKTLEILKEYPSASSAKEDGFNSTNIGQVCRGEKKSHKGYVWIYKDEYEEFIKDKQQK